MKKIYLSHTNKKIAGVCGGIGEFLNVDPTVVRMIFVFLAIVTAIFPMIFVYIIFWVIMPNRVVEGHYTEHKQS